MDKLKSLQLKKLLKELEFIESDFEYRNEMVSEADTQFISAINQFLIEHPDLKEIYDNKITEKINQSIKKKEEESAEKNDSEPVDTETEETEHDKHEEVEETEEEIKNKTNLSHIKKLYREIVKLTHPDKIKNQRLNDLYLKATKYYDENNKIGIYAVCNELNISYEISDDDVADSIN